ncbi:MAG: hypothetical protein H7Z37_00195 [Pyrinomonadaceae bacterium]|nr:hypothetical protein [Pyrinomonadaceae bacterium]
MENEFDREIDVLLRDLNGAAKISVSESEHLDADEIAAFAENAVPQNARLRYITHFADCDSCRETLKNFAELENEFQPQTVQDESVVTNTIAAKTIAKTSFLDWFKLPVLAYATAAFTILIIGTVALFAILQSSENSQNSVARVEKINQVTTSNTSTTIYTEPRSEENKATQSNETASSGAAMSNSSASMSNTDAKDSNVSASVNQKSSRTENADKGKPTEKSGSSSFDGLNLQPSPKPTGTTRNARNNLDNADAEVLAQSENRIFNQSQNDDLNEGLFSQSQQMPQNQQTSPTQTAPSTALARKPQSSQNEAKKREAQDLMAAESSARDSSSGSRSVENLPLNGRAMGDKDLASKRTKSVAKSVATKQVNGKTFRRENNVWIDSNYNGKGTTNIVRGSDEYRKLDANVRSIAENLGGEVVIVVANGKAFRIR